MSKRTNIETVVGCPFCGEPPTAKKFSWGGHDKHMVVCSAAACPVGPTVIGATRADAIRRWNTRKAKTQDVTFAMLYSLADSCKLLVAAIEQINGTCQTLEQRIALAVGRAVLEALQRLEHADHDLRDGDTTREGEQ